MKKILAALFIVVASQANAANVFWSTAVTGGGGASCTNGTFKWDADSGTGGAAHKCWATATGGTTATTVPGTGDTAIFDANSCSASGSVSLGASTSITSLTTSAMTGSCTFDFAGFMITMSGVWTDAGTNAHTISGTGGGGVLFTGTNAAVNTLAFSGSNTTVTAGQVAVTFTPSSTLTAIMSPTAAGKSWGDLTINFPSSVGTKNIWSATGTNTWKSITVNGAGSIIFPSNATTTITNNATFNGTSSAQQLVTGSAVGSNTAQVTLSIGGNMTSTWTAIGGVTCTVTGTVSNTNDFDAGNNSSCSITVPSAGGGGRIIGG